MGTQYLIRFDDICPTMNWPIWTKVEEILLSAGVKPILAVIPDNQDPNLRVCEAKAYFWDEVRSWQKRGWTIGLHGYQHLQVTKSGGILDFNKWSEFSGLTLSEQTTKLLKAREIFDREGVIPELWVAPAHSFDANTLEALNEIGLRYLSDGFSLYPYHDSYGMMWVPQQLWHFRRMPAGVWTICLHLNNWGMAEVDGFRSHVREFAALLGQWDLVVSEYQRRKRGLIDAVFARVYPATVQARQWLRQSNFSGGFKTSR